MRKRESVKIDDAEFTVKELTVKEIIEATDLLLKPDSGVSFESLDGFMLGLERLLPLIFETPPEVEALKSMAPSELKTIYEAFLKANDSFFDVARSIGLGNLMSEIRGKVLEALVTDFGKLAAS